MVWEGSPMRPVWLIGGDIYTAYTMIAVPALV